MSPPSLARSALLAVLVPLALGPSLARAEVGAAPFAPSHQQQLVGLEDFTFDSDWFPMGAPLQLRLIAHGGNSVTIDMPGAGQYDWSAETIQFTGEAGAGTLAVDIGFTLDALVRFDVLGLKWESDIIGPYDYAVIADAGFTPYLLLGNPERPVVIDDETDPVTLVSVPVTPDIIVAAGNLDIDIFVIVEASLEGDVIEAVTSDPELQLVSVVSEGEAVPLAAGPGPTPDPLLVDGTLVCGLRTAPTVVLRPTLVMEILGQKFEIANIEIPIAIPPFDDQIRFAPIAMSFPRPPPDPGADSHGDSHGYSSSDSDTPTSGDEDTGAGSGSTGDSEGRPDTFGGSAGEAGAGGPGDEGCACDVRTQGPGSAALLWLALLGLRRRRA
jgi:hypothetical protein